MRDEIDLLLRFVAALERSGSAYFVTGSVASMLYGEPRYTQDVDVVMHLTRGAIGDFKSAFQLPDYYVDLGAMLQAQEHDGQFNIIDNTTGLKVDVMSAADTPYNRSRFQRARRVELVPDKFIVFAAPEDVILMKLHYFKEGKSDKHLRDIASMFKVSGETFDLAYLERWALTLGVAEELAVVRERVRTATDFV
jgi:hypothetical protein